MYCKAFFVKLSRILLAESHSSEIVCSRISNNNNNLTHMKFRKNCIVLSNRRDYVNVIVAQTRGKSTKSHVDYSKVPKLDENDLEEQFVRGNGPGGQATAKTNNAVVLKHKPTGIVVKCHETRSLWENKKRAREILITRLDNMMNGQDSIDNQERLLLAQKSSKISRKKEKMSALKAAFKKREGID